MTKYLNIAVGFVLGVSLFFLPVFMLEHFKSDYTNWQEASSSVSWPVQQATIQSKQVSTVPKNATICSGLVCKNENIILYYPIIVYQFNTHSRQLLGNIYSYWDFVENANAYDNLMDAEGVLRQYSTHQKYYVHYDPSNTSRNYLTKNKNSFPSIDNVYEKILLELFALCAIAILWAYILIHEIFKFGRMVFLYLIKSSNQASVIKI